MATAVWLAGASNVSAQAIEVTPFKGYRFGGDFFELMSGSPIDRDGAGALGITVDIPMGEGLQAEGLFTRQEAQVSIPGSFFRPPAISRMTVDHWQGGGLQEFGGDRIRPYLTGTLGLTRFAAESDSEIRFSLGAGGGVKLFPARHIGVRLDGRLFATFVDAEGSAFACTPGFCFLAINADVIWQAEFSAGIVIGFGDGAGRSRR